MKTNDELLDEAGFNDADAALVVVERCLDERGELDTALLYELRRLQRDGEAFQHRALRLRADWFRKRGERIPKMPKPAHDIE